MNADRETAGFYMLSVYVPLTHAEHVKGALFEAGAGHFGLYDRCAWQTQGTGQFRPLAGSDPFAGNIGHVEQTEEVKIEIVCAGNCIDEAIKALKRAHPYETPAFHYWEVYGTA